MNQKVHRFDASLFHPDLGGEPVGGAILIRGRVLQFNSEAYNLDLPFDSLEVEFEQGGQGIFFYDANNPEVKLFTLDQAILRHPGLKAHPPVAAVLGRREINRAVRLTLYFLGGCVVATWIGSLVISGMVRAIAAEVPMSYEKKMGEEAMTELKDSGMLLDDSNNVAQLTALAAPLVQVLPAGRRDLRFHIVEDFEPNAFALPGGDVVVNTGLLKMADKPEELLGVLAHEIAHQVKRHAIRKRIAAAGPLAVMGFFLRSGSGVGNLLVLGSGLMIFQGFSQEYETEADVTGWDYLVAANIDPRGMIHALQKLERAEGDFGMKHIVPQAFQSHPAMEKRIARLERKWNHLGRQSGFVELQPVTWTFGTNQPSN